MRNSRPKQEGSYLVLDIKPYFGETIHILYWRIIFFKVTCIGEKRGACFLVLARARIGNPNDKKASQYKAGQPCFCELIFHLVLDSNSIFFDIFVTLAQYPYIS